MYKMKAGVSCAFIKLFLKAENADELNKRRSTMKGLIFLFAMGSVVLGQIDSTELWKHMSVEQLRVVRSNYNQEIARVQSMWNEYRDKSKNEQDLSVAQKDAGSNGRS